MSSQTVARDTDPEAALGNGIRTERLRQNMTLAQLAELTGLSPSALSQIERGVTDPSIGSLRRIASALQVPFFQFLLERESPDPVVRKHERRTITFPNRAMQYQLLTPNLRGPFEVLAMDLAPGAASGEEALGHDSEECMLILSGDVEVEVAGVSYVLGTGDSISIQRNAPHRVLNPG
ncbi:MAG TPA: helix-turn-helix domain-containing protein, partial [Chloroflexota bacterium]